jgi:hypothetical protein
MNGANSVGSNEWCEQCRFFATYWFTSVPKYMSAYRTNKNGIMYVGVKDVSVIKDAIWLENLHFTLPEYQDMFHYGSTHYFVSRTLPIK